MWQNTGTEFVVTWAGRRWALRLNQCPGLYSADDDLSFSVLTLAGILTKSRSWPGAFHTLHLVEASQAGQVVRATYSLPDAGGLRIRARWSISAVEDAIDLEVEAAASSVGEIHGLEVCVRSQTYPAKGPTPTSWNVWITPRDARSAAFSYDGREPESLLQSATSLPIPSQDKPAFLPRLFSEGTQADPPRYYIEMVQPNDCSRRLTFDPIGPGRVWRHAGCTDYKLFGHDIEKGVILRARLRGLWRCTETPDEVAFQAYNDFTSEPLPLGP